MPAPPPAKQQDPQAEQYGRELLAEARKQQPDIDQVKWLIDRADLTLTDITGSTALMLISGWSNLEVTQKLLIHGAVINQQDRNGNSVVHMTAHSGNEKTLETLLVYGANVALPNKSGNTPYDIAQGKFSHAMLVKLKEQFEQQDPGLVARRDISAYIDEQGMRLAAPTPAPQRAAFKVRQP